MRHDGFTGGRGHNLAAQSDQTAGRNLELEKLAAHMLFHLDHLAAADADKLDDLSGGTVGNVNRQGFDRLAFHAVDLFVNDVRLGNGELITLAAHVFDQNGDVKNAASADLEAVVEFLDAQSDVALRFLEKTLADVAAADEFAFLAEERGVVDAEDH